MITQSIEIDRSPEDVFTYLDDLERHSEWQTQIVSTRVETDGPVRVGTRVREQRRIGGRNQDTSYEITEHDPPRRSAFQGIAGPVRPVGTITLEALGDGSRTRLTLEFDLVGHGLGKLVAPLARKQARRDIEQTHARLKARLESAG